MGIIPRHLIAAALAVAVATPAAAQSIRPGKTAGGIAYDVQGAGPALVLITGSNFGACESRGGVRLVVVPGGTRTST